MEITMLSLAERYLGIRELSGAANHPLIQWWHSLCFDGSLSTADDTPWCSSFLNGMAWELDLPRSKSAMAKSWLSVGRSIPLQEATPGFDVVVLWRVARDGPWGHCGLFDSIHGESVSLLGGNQGNAVTLADFPASRVLGVRRIVG